MAPNLHLANAVTLIGRGYCLGAKPGTAKASTAGCSTPLMAHGSLALPR
jgi:hypothetical protein